jgi:uncharacterized phage protein (TIGR01671 family)
MKNRQIKFRVFDKLSKKFFYPNEGYQGHFILNLNGEFYNLNNGSGGSEYIVQQFTGLKDKNNKEIYEGDIVKEQFDYNDDPQRLSDIRWSKNTSTVIFDENEHRFGLKENNPRFSQDFSRHLPLYSKSNDIEVVGNILENK